MIRPNSSAFTLIELLVVITIIVVLLALLTPALDKAIYQAELAVCASNIHTMTTGVTVYATEHKRRWPAAKSFSGEDDGASADRSTVADVNSGNPHMLGSESEPRQDRRTVLDGYVSLKLHLDPLGGGKVDHSLEGNDVDTYVWGDYLMFFGWRYRTGGQFQAGMMKLGDRWAFGGRRYSILAQDVSGVEYAASQVHQGHPDYDGVAEGQARQNHVIVGAAAGDFSAGIKATLARWYASTHRRGGIDLNSAYSDGSVARKIDVPVGDSPQDVEGFAGVPWYVDEAAAPDFVNLVPIQ